MTENNKTIVKINVSSMCMESYPCQHHMEIEYDDGSTKKCGISGWSAVTNSYWNYLSEPDKKHFAYMKDMVSKKDNTDDYSDFLNYKQ